MPWSNQNGGGGPWGGGGNNQGPWGQGPNRPRGSGGKGGPPDLEDIIRRGQDQLRNIVPGGFNGGVAVIVLAIVAVFWLIQCVYTVQPDERGVELRFGKPRETVSMPGLHFHFWPMDTVEIVKVTEQLLNVGGTQGSSNTAGGLMLSGDPEHPQCPLQRSLSDQRCARLSLQRRKPRRRRCSRFPKARCAEVVGRRPAQDAFRDRRLEIASEVANIIQDTMSRYSSGISINKVTIEDVAPPREVADAFQEVQRADQDKQRLVEEANQYANQKLGQARGDGARIREDAAAYKGRVVKEAEGEAQRFIAIDEQYSKAPDVTRKRLFLETMEQVLKNSRKVIIEEKQGVVPYLPLNEISRPSQQGG